MAIPRCQANWLPSQVWRLYKGSLDMRLLRKLTYVACVCVLYPILRIYASVPVQASWHFVTTPLGTDHCLKLYLHAARTHICTRCGRQVFTGQHSSSQTPQSGSSSPLQAQTPAWELNGSLSSRSRLLHCHTVLTPHLPSLLYGHHFQMFPPNARPTFPNIISRKKGPYASMAWIAQWVDHLYGLHIWVHHIEPKHITAHLTPASGTPPATSEPCCAAWGLSSPFSTCSTSSSLTLQTQ